MDTVDISYWKLAGFMLIILIPLAINSIFKLKLSTHIGIAVTRMTLQLLMVGLYLEILFSLNSVTINFLWLMIMLLIGSSAVTNSSKLPLKYVYFPVLCGLVLGLVPILAVMMIGLLQPTPLYHAQYLIPLAGILLGNSLTGNIVALQHLFKAFSSQEADYEAALALGATPKQATFDFVRDALKSAQAPTLATMTTTGLVSLPGMMTGQILGGSPPIMAIKYQLVIMLAIYAMLSLSVAVTLSLSITASITVSGRIKFRYQQ